MSILLPTLRVLELTGTDALRFAHAQFASDVHALEAGHWQWSAWLSAQGRVRALFQLLHDGQERLRLLLRGGDASAIGTELTRYVLRSQVRLRVADEIAVVGITDPTELPSRHGALPQADEVRTTAHGDVLAVPGGMARWLWLAPRAALSGTDAGSARDRWYLAEIRAGLPELPPCLAGELLPQWLGLDRLGAIHLGKGCYPGQEIMARLHFKGGNRRGLYRLALQCAPPSPGTTVYDAARQPAGTIVLAARVDDTHSEALASLLDASASQPLYLAEPTVALRVAERFR
jgi:hypothetical protein